MSSLVIISANTHREPYAVYPLALSYLSTYLQEHLPALCVHIVDMNWTTLSDGVEQVMAYDPDFIGISLRNIDNVDAHNERYFVEQYRALMLALRQRSAVPIIIGGAGFSIFPELLCETLKPDYAIKGEGEIKLAALLQCLLTGAEVPAMEGLFQQGQWGREGAAAIPYLRQPKLKFDTALATKYWHESGMLSVQTKRGCPYRCVYCSYPKIDGRKIRTLDINHIISSLHAMKNQHGADYVFFTDSVFNIKNDFNRRLADALIDADLGVKWGAYFSPYQLKEDDLALFQEAGLTHVEFGTESLADATLSCYGKPFQVKDVFRAAAACDHLGLYQAHFLILGGPGETEQTLKETFQNAELLPSSVLFPFLGMRIYPGTPLHQTAVKEGLVRQDDPLLQPAYYCAEGIALETIKQQTKNSARRWVFSDEDFSNTTRRLRQRRHRSGPLWELLMR